MERDILRQNRELSTLNTVNRVIAGSLDQREVLKRSLERVLDVTSVDAGEVGEFFYTRNIRCSPLHTRSRGVIVVEE